MHPLSRKRFVPRSLLSLGLLAALISPGPQAWGQAPDQTKPEEKPVPKPMLGGLQSDVPLALRQEFPYSEARVKLVIGVMGKKDAFRLDALAFNEEEKESIRQSALRLLGLTKEPERLLTEGLKVRPKPEIKTEYKVAPDESLILQARTGRPITRIIASKGNVVQIEDVDVTNPTEVRIIGRNVGLTPLSLTDDEGDVTTTVIRVEPDLTFLREAVSRQFPKTNVVLSSGTTNRMVVVSGTVDSSEDIAPVLRFIGGFAGEGNLVDNLRVAGPIQVQLEVCIAQVQRSELRQIGFNFFAVTSDGDIFLNKLGNVVAAPTYQTTAGMLEFVRDIPNSPAQLVYTISNSGTSVHGFLEALRTEGAAHILANPTLTTVSGRAASFLAGGEVPVPQASPTGTPSIQFKEFGTRLSFVPVILGDGRIRLEVEPEVSQAVPSGSIQGAPLFSFITQRIHTSVELENGQTLAIGGLTQTFVNATTAKYPILGDLPFVGVLWRRTRHEEQEQELLVIVTPRLVDGIDDGQRTVKLPGQETRPPTDFELFLEGILEAPRGRRDVCPGGTYRASHLGDLTSHCGTVGVCGDGTARGQGCLTRSTTVAPASATKIEPAKALPVTAAELRRPSLPPLPIQSEATAIPMAPVMEEPVAAPPAAAPVPPPVSEAPEPPLTPATENVVPASSTEPAPPMPPTGL